MYGQGISREGLLLDVAVELGFVKKSGAGVHRLKARSSVEGRENVEDLLVREPQPMAEIDDRVRESRATTPRPRTSIRGRARPRSDHTPHAP